MRPQLPANLPARIDAMLPLAGAAFTALMVAASAAFPMPPGGDVSAAAHPAWLASHRDAVIAQSYLRGLAAVALMVLVVAVASAIRRFEGDRSLLAEVALIGGTFSAGLLLAAQACGLASGLFSGTGGGADAVRAIGEVQDAFLDLSILPAILLFASVSAAALRSQLLPRWLAVFTLAGVPIAALDAISYKGSPIDIGILGLVYLLAWSLLVGIRLYLQSAQAALDPAEPEGGPAPQMTTRPSRVGTSAP